MSLPDIKIPDAPIKLDKIAFLVELEKPIYQRLEKEKSETFLPMRRIVEKALKQFFGMEPVKGKNEPIGNQRNFSPDGAGGIRRDRAA